MSGAIANAVVFQVGGGSLSWARAGRITGSARSWWRAWSA